ncbi:MAG: hypothetical protein FWD35_05870 [Oscillospiraceae bacterium]|nr:hypothetical protein [Oscillospiraceae bacterium]
MNTIDAKDFLFTLKRVKDEPMELNFALAQAEARLSEKDRADVEEKYNAWRANKQI